MVVRLFSRSIRAIFSFVKSIRDKKPCRVSFLPYGKDPIESLQLLPRQVKAERVEQKLIIIGIETDEEGPNSILMGQACCFEHLVGSLDS